MPESVQRRPHPWFDQFRTPAEKTLLAGQDEIQTELFSRLRAALAADLTETLAWRGIPWRWSFAYTSIDGDTPAAFLIPEPGKPQLAVPLPIAFVDTLKVRRLSKPVRDGILLAKPVSGILWAEWDLTSQTLVDDLTGLVNSMLGQALAKA